MRRVALLLALAAAASGCGGTGADLPEGADESYERWRDRVEVVCQGFREEVEKLPNPGSEAREGTDREKLRKLGEAARPIADLYADAARRTRAVPLPRSGVKTARDYVERFERRARAYGAIPAVATRGDREATEDLIERDEQLAKRLAFATEQAAVRC